MFLVPQRRAHILYSILSIEDFFVFLTDNVPGGNFYYANSRSSKRQLRQRHITQTSITRSKQTVPTESYKLLEERKFLCTSAGIKLELPRLEAAHHYKQKPALFWLWSGLFDQNTVNWKTLTGSFEKASQALCKITNHSYWECIQKQRTVVCFQIILN